MLPLRACKKHQHLLPRADVLDDGVLFRIRLQRLEPRLVLFGANRLQPHKHADPVENGRLAELYEPVHGRLNGRFH
jgi:hypothetical protein